MTAAKYKQTEIGIIPEDWEVKCIKELFTFLSTATYSRAQLGDNGEFQCLHYGDIHTKYNNFVDFGKTELPKILNQKNTKYALLQDGDVVMADASEDYVGLCKSIEIKNIAKTKAISGLHTILLREKGNEFINGFKGFLFDISFVRKQLIDLATGMKVFGVSKKNLESVLLPIPSLAEQSAIATALSDMDEYILSLERLIAKKKAIKQGAMQQLLTGKIRLKGCKGEWVDYEIGKIGKFYSGLTGKTASDFGKGDAKYITFLNVLTNVVIKTDILEQVNIGKNEQQNAVQKGDLFFNTSSETPEEVGMCAVLQEDLRNTYLNSFCFGFRLMANEINPLFFSYLFNSAVGRKIMFNLAQGATRYNLSKSYFEKMIITIPTLAEQSAIATILSDMDTEIEALQTKLQKAKLIKQGAMQQLLTGKVRINAGIQIQTVQKKPKQANIHFKRSVWAAEIADRLCNEPTFGHVKMEKLLFLTENMCGIDIGSHYHRDAAGPYDNRAIRSIDSQLKKQNWFEVVRKDMRNQYVPMAKRGEHKNYFNNYFSDVLPVFDKVISIFKTWNTERCEIVATLYSAWKDLANTKRQYTDKDIINEVLNNWNESKKRIPEERWQKALDWMRKNGFTPKK